MKKRIMITGASSGLGFLCALKFARLGHDLVLVARRKDRLESLRDQCCEHGLGQVVLVDGDIAEFTLGFAVRDALESLGEGEPVLISNAGSAVFGDFESEDFSQHWREVQVNLGGTMAMTHAVLPEMLKYGTGQIVQVLSVAADHVFSGAAVYSSAKAGLRQFGRCLNEEYRKRGLRVTNLLPGAIDTPLWDSQMGSPPRDLMLSAEAVTDVIVQIVESPSSLVMEEVRLTPPNGIL